jgi:hypothetical protein
MDHLSRQVTKQQQCSTSRVMAIYTLTRIHICLRAAYQVSTTSNTDPLLFPGGR